MLRPPRILVALALLPVLPVLTVGTAAAEQNETPYGVANNARRQAILHRHWPADGVPGSMLVTATTARAAAQVAADEGGTVLGTRTVLLHVEPGTEADVAGRVAAEPGVLGIEPDRVRAPAAVPNDPGFSDQWSHTITNVQSAWDRSTGSSSVTVAVLDTGVDGRHTDLLGNIVEQVDLSSGHKVTRQVGSDNDSCNVGHGTFVAGVIGAVGNNGTGVAGVAWGVSIVDVALTSNASRCGILDSSIVAGLAYVTDASRPTGPVDIVNLSLGGLSDSCPTSVQTALDDARAAGTIVVAAAGNEQMRTAGAASIPASCAGVVSVGAVGDTGQIAPYSNENEWVDVTAPGGDSSTGRGIVSTSATCTTCYAEEEGTSFASPYVAGAMALLLSIDPSLTPDELEGIIESTASDRGASGRDPVYGWGLVDVGAAAALAAGGSAPSPAPDPSFPVENDESIVERVAPDSGSSSAIAQAVAMSTNAFESLQAFHAILARDDDFADALAGSALGFGVGPVLFTKSTGPIASSTAAELQRVLEPGSTVYLLGGTAALPASLENDVRALGFEPVRLAGTTRMLTAIEVAKELDKFLTDNEFDQPDVAIVATAFNWPDAVSAGALGAWFGIPILLTSANVLDPSVESYLSNGTWSRVYVIGGTAAISDDTRRAVRDAARITSGETVRLAGTDRSGTTVAVGSEFERLFAAQFQAAFGEPGVPRVVAAVNLRQAGGFAHVLSASALLGEFSGVFVPVEGAAGTTMTSEAQAYTCRFPAAGIVVGSTALISNATSELFDQLLRGDAPACTG